MTAMTLTEPTRPFGRPFTAADLAAMPDDGHRYEILDGTLLVSPSPVPRHQKAVVRLARLLEDACPAHLETYVAPLDVHLADDTVLEPDVLVVAKSDVGEETLGGVPVLVVEVLSPSTRLIDLGPKRTRFEEAGCPAYWVVDPVAPEVTAWHLQGGRYAEPRTATGDAPLRVDVPFAVTVVPARLVD